ncbi:MAG: inositol monophosphatase family protein [Elusimicrobiota bacterium]
MYMKEREIALKAVIKAGEILKKYFGRVGYKLKGRANPVTLADLKSQETIIKELKKSFPEHGFIAEESGLKRINRNKLWILDPLDGTVNYAHGYPHCAISLACVSGNTPVLAFIYNPLKEELFSAVKGRGAYLNGKKISVSSVSSIKDSLLATGFAYDRAQKADFYCSFYSDFMKISHDIRRAGAASLDMAWTACGRLDGYWEFNLKPWDVAAGILINEEAGGKVTDFEGKKLSSSNIFSWGKQTLCSNGLLHRQMLARIKEKI